MEVQVYRATLTVEGRTVRLTKAIAKQFPIHTGSRRWDTMAKGESVPEPICKVNGKTLGASSNWLYLVEDSEAGLVWVPPVGFYPALLERMRERGGDEDDPSEVPTVIL